MNDSSQATGRGKNKRKCSQLEDETLLYFTYNADMCHMQESVHFYCSSQVEKFPRQMALYLQLLLFWLLFLLAYFVWVRIWSISLSRKRSSDQFEFEAAAGNNVAEAGISSSRANDDDENGINTRKNSDYLNNSPLFLKKSSKNTTLLVLNRS